MKIKIKVLVIIFLLNCFYGFSGKEVRSARLTTAGINAPSSTLVVNDDKFTDVSGWNSSFYDLNNSVKIEFGINEENHLYHGAYFYAEIVFDVQFRDATPSSSSVLTKTLQIDYRPSGGVYKDKDQILFSGYYRASISNMTITAWDSPSKTNTVSVPSDLYLDAEITTDRIYPFNLGSDAIASTAYNHNYLSTSNELEIYWDYFNGAEEYELEWTFVDNYNGTGGSLTPSSTNLLFDFNHDATRVITSNTYYRIPLVYEQGYIVYRIRPIGRNNSNEREDGAWTISPTGSVYSLTSGGKGYYLISTALGSDNINWSSTQTFSEYAKHGVGVSYMDALSFNRQSIARLNTEEKSIVQSTLFDHFGRAAINFLPAPVSGLNFSYVTNLNKTNSSTTFDKRIFDLCTNNSCNSGNSIVLDSTNSAGAAKYFSGSNPDTDQENAFIPTALGLPYSQIKYNKDPLGRIAEQTLPGSLHKLSSGKGIEYFYTKPSQIELDRLFGSEGGSALHFEKHITKDPNGQYSSSYIDMYGRTVGTALIGDAPSNTQQLSDITSSITLKDDLISVNQLSDHCYEVNTSFFVTYSGEQQTFTYTTNIGVFVPKECTNKLCFDCQYDLYLSITDECGDQYFYDHDNNSSTPSTTYVNVLGAEEPYQSYCLPTIATQEEIDAYNNAHKFVLSSATSNTNIVITFPHPGVYNLHKKICVSDKPVDDYLNIFLEDATCNKKLCDYIDSLTNRTSFSTCSVSCNSCSQFLSDYNTIRQNNASDSVGTVPYYPPYSQAEIDEMTDKCEQINCGKGNMCNSIKQQLKADFFPGALFGATTSTASGWQYSIYNASNTGLPTSTASVPYSWSNPPLPYKDSKGNPATVNYLGNTINPESLPSYTEFINHFQPSWTEAFLPIHPEYCKMKFYCDVLGSSLDYDAAMKKVEYYDDACALGFIKPYQLTTGSFSVYPPAVSCATNNLDPMFTVTSGTLYTLLTSGSAWSNFNSSMLDYVSGTPTINIYQEASLQTLGGSIPSGHTFGSDICWADMEWQKFRELYLNLKNSLYNTLYSDYTNTNNGTALCSPNVYDSEHTTNHVPMITAGQNLSSNLGFTHSSGSSDSTTVANMLAANCATACASYADLWIQNIKGSCAYSGLSAADTVNLRRDLIAVCEKGCDYSHPWGSTNYPTGGTPTPYTIPSTSTIVYSFQDVFDYYFGTNNCDANLITAPSPYNVNGMGSGSLFLSDCGCDQLLQVDYDFTNNINVPSGITSARKLFNLRYQTELKDYNHLVCVCKSAVSGTWSPGHNWTSGEIAILTADSVYSPPMLKCDACVTCTSLESVVSSMATQYGFTASNLTSVMNFINNNNQVALNYFNNSFNLTNSLQDYVVLLNDCRQFSASNTFSNNITPEASALQLYLNDLASHKLLATDHNMSFCLDEKYYMSDLYEGNIPAIGNNYYDASVSGNTLTIQIKATPSSTSALCTITLTLPSSSPSWSTVNSAYNIMAYAPSPSAGALYSFQLGVSNGTANAVANGTATCWAIANLSNSSPYGPQLCPKTKKVMPNKCQKDIMSGIIIKAKTLYNYYLSTLKDKFKLEYLDTCIASLHEAFTREFDLKEYHYTLYYYDQAGNLNRTVAPNGVTPLSITYPIGSGTPQYPSHSSSTFGVNKYFNNAYYFNSYNEPVMENSVDGGLTIYFYDKIGRIVASQNARQYTNNAYSYTIYDIYGRISEVGQVKNCSDSSGVLTTYMAEDSGKLSSFIASGTKTEVIRSYYDETPSYTNFANAAAKFSASQQENLRNRVAAVSYENSDDSNNNTYDFATHYTYDEHGNAKEVVHENVSLDHLLNQRYKRTDYEFELVSGNVIQVTYQKNQLDQFMHRYYYDADNRLKEVFTSHDGTNWDKDAKYVYYEHGPLARVETGDKQVQAQDYFYTIHGWLKGMNSNQLAIFTDPGKDGSSTTAYNSAIAGLHQYTAKDVASYNLNYYKQGADKDYLSIKTHTTSSDGNPMMDESNIRGSSYFNLNNDAPDLYNGNISSMVTGILNMDASVLEETSGNPFGVKRAFPQITAYQYDQLHRISQMKTFREFTSSTNNWATPTTSNYNDSYLNQFTYDANGNILSQYRNGASPVLRSGNSLNMDDLDYTYYNLSALKTNKLLCVGDNSGYTSNYSDDVDDQSTNCVYGSSNWTTTNYSYDETGNLISDSAECIKNIEWTVDRKVKKITRSAKQLTVQGKTLPDIEYLYDASRKRIAKITKPRDVSTKGPLDQSNWIYTYYNYDASGNVMATYERTYTLTASGFTDIYDLKEYDIYGSKRLGLVQDDSPPLATRDFSASINHFEFVNIEYDTPPAGEDIYWDTPERWLGNKKYELTNHLGNVITVVSDRKIPAALSNTNCVQIFDMENGVPSTIFPQNMTLSAPGGELVGTIQNGYWISGIDCRFGYNITPTSYLIEFDFDPGTVDINDGLWVLPFDYDYNTYSFYMGSYYCDGTWMMSKGHHSFVYTPTATGTNVATFIAFYSNSTSTHHFKIDNLTMCPITDIPVVQNYNPEVLKTADYYPFGQTMPGRKWQASPYRYGYEQQESDDEVYGDDNLYAFEYRMHDPRLGRFWSVDPLFRKYPWNSPYAFSENRVISAIELEGLEAHDLNGGTGSVNHAAGEQGPQPMSGTVNGPYVDGATANKAALSGAPINYPEMSITTSPSSALSDRAANPSLINQGRTSLCGPTTIAQAMARHNPDGYKALVKTFYQLNLGGNDARDKMGMKSMSDWYMLTGLKNVTSPLPYGNQTNSGGLEGLQGMTLPSQMQAMANLVGLKTYGNTLSVLPGVGNVDNFFANLDAQAIAGKTVILLINSDVINGNAQSNTPNHYIIYEAGSYKSSPDGTMQFNAQTWGQSGVQFGPVSKARADLKGLFGAMILGN